MIKIFEKGKHYTLCLINCENDEIITWYENVTFKLRIGQVLEFSYSDGHFTVDLDTKIVVKSERTIVPTYQDIHYVDEDFDEIEKLTYSTLTNIVKGWQF